MELTNLKLLNVSHNKIWQIHLNAFDGMDKLKTLDLSYNSIEYFTKSWFEDWVLLEELYLRGNKLRSINEQPRIAAASLKVGLNKFEEFFLMIRIGFRSCKLWNNKS